MSSIVSCLKQYFSPAEIDSPKTNNFNILRFFAAFTVIYGHMSSIMGYAAFPLLSQRVSTIGVKIFFTVSGFLITKSFLSDPHFGRYMVRRCFRIFPALIVLVLLSAFVVGPVFTTLSVSEYFTHPQTWQYLKNALLSPVYALPGVFTDCPYPNAVNGSLWTLPVEFFMYLLLPPLALLFKRLGSVKWGMGACAVLTLAAAILQTTLFPTARLVIYGTNWFDLLPLLPYYFIGSFFSFSETRKYLNLQMATVLLVLAVLVPGYTVYNELAVVIALPYFILSFSLAPRPLFSKWFAKSDYSYGLYLYGFVIQQILYALIKPVTVGVLPMALLSFAVTLVFAVLSWHLIEKNAQRVAAALLKRIGKPKEIRH